MDMDAIPGQSVTDRLMRHRIIFLDEEVSDRLAAKIIGSLLLLDGEDPERDITLFINSPGGSVSAGLAIYDVMNFVRPDVRTVCAGIAASMAQFMLCAGTPGKRASLPNARILMHQGSAGVGGDETDIAIQAKELGQLNEQLSTNLATMTGQTVDQIMTDSDRDNWFSPQEALDYGMIDEIITKATDLEN